MYDKSIKKTLCSNASMNDIDPNTMTQIKVTWAITLVSFFNDSETFE